MGAAVSKAWITKIMAAIVEAIFVVCRQPDTRIRQCPLSLEKWLEPVNGPRQNHFGPSHQHKPDDRKHDNRVP